MAQSDVRTAQDVWGDKACVRLALAVVFLLAFAVATRAGDETPRAPKETTVRLVIDYGDGVQKHFTRLEWREGVTVFEVLQGATHHPRGIRVKHRGKGATVLVTHIDDMQSEGGAGTGRNWIYRVNDEVADRSAGIRPVERGDTILWRFETYR